MIIELTSFITNGGVSATAGTLFKSKDICKLGEVGFVEGG